MNAMMMPISTDEPPATLSVHPRPRVALVSMPFVSVYHPSIQVGLLTSIAKSYGFSAVGYHFNIDFAQVIGSSLFEALCEVRERRDGEWLFSREAFGDACPDDADLYIEAFGTGLTEVVSPIGKTVANLVTIRNKVVPAFLDYLLDLVEWDTFDVVGFTSTFQQNVASFALARRIKQKFPHVITLFGGSNFEAEMGRELVRTISAIDFAILGEADEAFPAFLRAVAEDRDPRTVPGVATRGENGEVEFTSQQPFTKLDESPTPDYSDYFTQALNHGVISQERKRTIAVPFESSRGCWWGEKRHCVFCGLNGNMMKYRAKTASKVLVELSELARTYGSFQFVAVDNILPTEYFAELFDRLAADGRDFEFFYELKSNLSRDKIRTLRRGGVRWVQPGIESLSTHVLTLMRKGVTGIANLNTLRWCRHYGISVAWNLLWGFPGETDADYQQQAELMRHLNHLQPPVGFGPIWMERFSPVFTDPQSFPRSAWRPESSHRYVYPAAVDLHKVAYFFEYEFSEHLPESSYEGTSEIVRRWQEAWRPPVKPSMTFRAADDFVQIEDGRSGAVNVTALEGTVARLYCACSNEPRTSAQLKASLGLNESCLQLDETLQSLVDQGLAAREGQRFLCLALPWTSWR